MNEKLSLQSVKFFCPKPHAIRCMCFEKSTSRLAVSRSDSSIEVWDIKTTAYLEKVLHGDKQTSIETLVWFQGRLLSAGLDGHIVEYDLMKLTSKSRLSVASCAPIWCMSVSKDGKYLAVGNDDGHVVLHKLHCGELTFKRRFNKQEGFVLCLDWHKDGKMIVTGSLDTIRVYDVKSGTVVKCIILGRISKKQPTVVWSLAVLSDLTIVSGDSCGKISFWDGTTGTLVSQSSSPKDLKADILTIAVSENEKAVYSSGVDSIVTMYQKSESNERWIRSFEYNEHTHDVRCLLAIEDAIISGGDDCKMIINKQSRRSATKYSGLCQRFKNSSTLAQEVNCMLTVYDGFAEVVKLLPSKTPHFVSLIKMSPSKDESIVCGSISPNGKWLAYSTQKKLRLYTMDMVWPSENLPLAQKVSLPVTEDIVHPVTKIMFFSDSTKLVVYSEDKILIMKLDIQNLIVEAVIHEDCDDFKCIDLIELSPDNKYLAFGSSLGSVFIYNLQTFQKQWKLPVHKYRPTALRFDPASENIVVVYSDLKVVEYCLNLSCYTAWSKSEFASTMLKKESMHPITSIVFNGPLIIFQEESCIYVFKKEDEPEKKRKKWSKGSTLPVKKPSSSFRKVPFENLSNFTACSDGVMAVQIPSKHVLNCLPPPVYRKKFGT